MNIYLDIETFSNHDILSVTVTSRPEKEDASYAFALDDTFDVELFKSLELEVQDKVISRIIEYRKIYSTRIADYYSQIIELSHDKKLDEDNEEKIREALEAIGVNINGKT